MKNILLVDIACVAIYNDELKGTDIKFTENSIYSLRKISEALQCKIQLFSTQKNDTLFNIVIKLLKSQQISCNENLIINEENNLTDFLHDNVEIIGIIVKEQIIPQTIVRQFIYSNPYNWNEICITLIAGVRKIYHERNTTETKINITLDLDGTGIANIDTGLHFFNHMLEQIAKHAIIDMNITAIGDLNIDEHHTIEDTGIALGEVFAKALGNKVGIERYGFTLPMDDCLAQVAIDFGGRPWIVWNAKFSREKLGDMPTEMFFHFFKSFSDAAKCNLNITVAGENEHHKIESIFKAFAKAIKAAIKRDIEKLILPSTKGTL